MAANTPIDIFISCGELSGDQIGASIVKNLPHLACAGVIGPELRSLGVKEIAPMESLQILGIVDSLLSIFSLLRLRKRLVSWILKENPKAVLLVDFSGFHTLLAKKLKQSGYKGKIIKVVCPQIWAWRKHRKKHIEKYHDALFTLFPFEKDLFRNSSLHTVYIGHPVVKKILSSPLDRENIIALFPGSRKKDIIRNLPLQLQSVSTISDVRIFVSVSFEAYIPLVEKIAKQNAVQITVVLPKDRFALMRLATMAIAKFGTISLELALSLTPTVMMIQLDAFTAFLFKYFFRFSLPFYALPNILLQKPVFQEIIINASGESALKKAVTDLFYSSEKQVLQKDLCQQVKALFENMDPGERAATEILTLI